MDLVRKFFPISDRATTLLGLIISILIYAILPTVLGLVNSCTGNIPVIGWLVSVILSLIGLYCLVGIVISILIYLKVIK